MRKSGWAAATGIASLALLLTACGGSSATSAAGSGSGAPSVSSGSSGPAAPASSVTAAATATKSKKSNKSNGPSAPITAPPPGHVSVGPQPSSGAVIFPSVGTTVMVVQHSSIGFVLAKADGQVVYTYAKDKKGGAPSCTGSCAAAWPPVTGTPKAGPADTFPGTFGVVKGVGGVEQITYNGYPLYTFAGAKPFSTAGNGLDGVWHVVPLSAGDISA